MKMKSILSIIGLFAILIFVIVIIGYLSGNIPSLTTTPSKNSSNNQSNSPSNPSNPAPPASPGTTITYDFNTGVPVLSKGQNVPFSQTSNGITAYFSSTPDPHAFSIQSYESTFYTLSQFFGNYLWDNTAVKNTLIIKFSHMITDITLTFATVEYHGVGNVDEPSIIKITAYSNSTQLTSIGSATAQGVFSSDFYPQGILSYNGNGKVFNQVAIELASQNGPTTEFFVDTVLVKIAAQ